VGHYHSFINNNGGESNAWTDVGNTVYYFNIGNANFREGLDIFGQFFLSPLLDPKYVEKEMNAVDSEFSKNINNDLWRSQHLFRKSSNPESPFNMFSTGNIATLKIPDIYERLKTFYEEQYR
jgi:insulysin